ncbi:hypothetical protein BGZ76_007082 [Entomortierella beljakovae]|nr:hypothetical protein BGZ76_007082 [Entomortierella beljakovae]
MLLYFIGYLFVAWFALTIKVIDPASIGKSSTLNQFMNQVATKILSLMPKDISGLRSSYSSRRITHNSNEASMNETHVEIFSNGLGRKDPVAIRVEGLSLSMPLSNFEWSVSGIRKLLQRDRTEKHMLKDVHAVFPSGEMTAILGESGAGKTSLLKTLLNRIPSGHNVAGSVYYNNSKNPSLKIINSICSYVRQDDSLLIPHITVRETLRFEADLRMDSSILKADKYAKVEEIIDLVGLRDCAEVIVGNSTAVGCSGGQRRRVSVGIQLIRDPLCLFLDEPTSGLDAFTAKALVLTLKQIATTGRTVVCTIHQPGSDIWQLFDNVVLLVSGGRTVYSGCVDKVAEYFEDVGYVPPLYTNIPDFILDTISVNQRSTISEEESRKRVEKFVDLFNANKNTISAALNSDKTLRELGHKTPKFAPFSEALPILTRRSFVNTYRQKILYFNRIGQPIALSIVVAIFFAPLGNRPEDVINRLGLLQETALGVFAGMLNNVALYPLERNIAFREISDGGYSATSFFFSYMVNEIPLEIVTSLGVTVFMLVITRLEVTIVTFFSFWIVMFGYINAGESIGMIFSAFTTNDGLSTTIMSTVIGIFALMTGIMTLNMPQWLDGLNYISVLKYGTVILTRNEFEKKEFECSSNDISLGACTFQTGESVIELLNFQNLNWSLYMGLFVVIVISYRVLAWLALEASAIRNKWYY